MSLSAGITVELNTVDIVDIIECLTGSGWSIRDKEGKVNFLPVGDDENYSWSAEFMSDVRVRSMIKAKSERNETVGLMLYRDNECGSCLLFLPSGEMVVSCDINRRVITWETV